MTRRLAQLICIGGMLFAGIAPARANLAYHGGRVIPTIHIVPIFYGWPARDFALISGFFLDLVKYINGAYNPAGSQTVAAQYGVTGAVFHFPPEVADNNPRVLQISEALDIIHVAQAQSPGYAPDFVFVLVPGHGYTVAGPNPCGLRGTEGDGKYYAIVPGDCIGFNELVSRHVIDTATNANGDGWDEAIDPCFGHIVNFGSGNIALPWNNLAGSCNDTGFTSKSSELVQVVVSASGELSHTMRSAGVTWQPWRDVKAAVGSNPGFVTDVDCQPTMGIFNHVVGQASGKLFHTIRTDAGWTPFRDVNDATGAGSTAFARVGVANVNNELHVCATTTAGGVRHASRNANGSWTAFGDVLARTGSPGTVVDIDCAGIGSELHVVVATSAGGVFHAIRYPSSWTVFGNVKDAAGSIGSVRKVSAAAVAGDLHVTAVVSDGTEWWAIRRADLTWRAFDVPPNNISMADAANASVGNQLHLLSIGKDDSISRYRSLNPPNSWTTLRNLNVLTGNTPGRADAIGAAGVLGF